MPLDIYVEYAPTEAARKAKREAVYQQIVDMFKTECESLDAESADVVEIPYDSTGNSRVWGTIKDALPEFESSTKLTIFESKVMTIVKRDAILLTRTQEGI